MQTSNLTPLDRLLVFTRYPQAGRAKTRLIPILGAEGAADLQRQMTEYTLRQVQALRQDSPLSIEVWFAGSSLGHEEEDRHLMQAWLGTEWTYQMQQGRDLGDRLNQAITIAFEQRMRRVVTIGTDCPGLDARLMQQAFQKLSESDLVLGPATDGGYYLVGLRQLMPDLFAGINWGSETVLQQTIDIAVSMGLTITYLDPLTDVDRPEDLGVWQAVFQPVPEIG